MFDRAHALWNLFVKELAKFGVVGAAAFAINAGLVWVLMHTQYFAESHIKAKVVATVVAIIFSWVANRLWTFRDKRQEDKRKELVQFLVANGIGMGIELGCLGVSYYVLGLTSATASFISGTIIGTILGTIFRYFAYRFWVFSTKLDQDPDFASSPDQELAFITGQIPVIPQREDKTPRHDDPASHHGNPAPRPEDTVANTLPEQDVRRAS
ncbi:MULTISPECIES: GtrA family protein [Kocuria]|nr:MULTISPECIES: GtrA family protein [Kocuria]MBN6812421.1 GtrA family protein [Kocuria indica]MBN6844020.1 GtrA family protein [Kocuria indica]MCT1723644.1 GtrA family protein [Kocuria marina]MCT1734224.1 GtrA family protein [Kocuria marina]MCT2360605.1 GtrA family protein [Kocuria marina]